MKFVQFLKNVFVHNFQYKLLAFVLALIVVVSANVVFLLGQ